MQIVARSALALALAALAAPSFATTTVYTTSASFLAQVAPGAYFESFTGLPAEAPSDFSGNGFSYTLSAPNGIYGSGDFVGASQINEALTVSFTGAPVTAVGGNFFATNISDVFQPVSITLTLSDATTVTFTPATLADSYRGFTSTAAITSLTISGPGGSLYGNLDNLTVGVAAVVPEPASALLMALGAAALLVARRRRA